MSASPLLTINAAADQLQRDRRTIAAHLRDIPPDDKDAQGRLRWRLATIVRALSNERPQRGNSEAADAIEAAHEALLAGLKNMWAAAGASGPEAAREVVRGGVGGLVGALDRALERGLEGLKPHEQYLLGLARDKAVSAAIGEILGACQWEVRRDRTKRNTNGRRSSKHKTARYRPAICSENGHPGRLDGCHR
jgi:hypothetical protein